MKEFNGFQEFSAVYGPEGKIPEGMGAAEAKQYGELKIVVPEGLDEEFVTAIVMGAALKNDGLNQNLTGTAEETPEKTIAKNQRHLIDNVVGGDPLDKKFGTVLLNARKEAKEAVEAYAKGDTKSVNELLGVFTDYCAGNVKRITGPGEELDRTQKISYLGQTILKKKAPGIEIPEGKSSQVEKATLNSYSKQIDARFLSDQNKDILTRNYATMNKDGAKAMLVEDMLFYRYVSNMKDALKNSRRKATKKFVEDKISNYGVAPKSPEMAQMQELLANQKEEHIEEVEHFSISDFDAILAKPDGMSRLKQYYGDAIRQTEGYHKILEAKSDEELKEALEGAEKEAQEGFLSFKDIKLPKESDVYHEDAKGVLNNAMNSFNQKIEEALFGELGPMKKEIENNELKSFEKEDRLRLWLEMDEMSDELANLSGEKASDGFQNLSQQMENLKNLANQIAQADGAPTLDQFAQYNSSARSFCAEAGRFLEKTKGTQSPEEKKQRNALIQSRKKLMCQMGSYARLHDELENMLPEPVEKVLPNDGNNITTSHAADLEAVYQGIKHIPGVDKYQAQLQELKKIGERLIESTGVYSELTKDNFISACGASIMTLREGETKEVRKDMERGLEIIRQFLSDKQLMEKEPLLKAYLSVIETQTSRALSNRQDALGYLADDNASVMISAINLMQQIPTGEKYENLRKNNPATEKLVQYMNAYSEYYGLSEKLAHYVDEQGAQADYQKMKSLTDEKLVKLQQATEALANEKKENVRDLFHVLAGEHADVKEVNSSVDLIYQDEKHNLNTAAKQMADRRNQLQKNLSMEDIGVLQNYWSQIKTIFSNAGGLGVKIEHLPENLREPVNRLKAMADECKKRLEEGFENDEKKRDFFKRLGEESRKFVQTYENTEISENASMEEERARENLIGYSVIMAQNKNGFLRQAMEKEKQIVAAEKASDPQVIQGLKLYYEMMADTKSGYFGHTNSREYESMMASAKKMMELSQKQPLNDMEFQLLGKYYENLSKSCQAYLTDKKMKSKSTDIGEDRFAGALGILSVVDPVNAERLRNKASVIRGKNVTYSNIRKRANKRLEERRQKLAENARKEAQKVKKTKKTESLSKETNPQL